MTGSGGDGAPLLVGDGAAAAWRERCPGCRQQRRAQATDRIPYAAFLYVWISCLCAGTSIVSMRDRHKLKNNVDRPWESDSQTESDSERFSISQKNTQEGFAS